VAPNVRSGPFVKHYSLDTHSRERPSRSAAACRRARQSISAPNKQRRRRRERGRNSIEIRRTADRGSAVDDKPPRRAIGVRRGCRRPLPAMSGSSAGQRAHLLAICRIGWAGSRGPHFMAHFPRSARAGRVRLAPAAQSERLISVNSVLSATTTNQQEWRRRRQRQRRACRCPIWPNDDKLETRQSRRPNQMGCPNANKRPLNSHTFAHLCPSSVRVPGRASVRLARRLAWTGPFAGLEPCWFSMMLPAGQSIVCSRAPRAKWARLSAKPTFEPGVNRYRARLALAHRRRHR
jgi:hypothetical protein